MERHTPRQVRLELERRGFPVSHRWLLNGPERGLLPNLIDRGRGRPNGKVYYWADPRIVEQVIVVRQLLRSSYPADQLPLSLWLMEFSCEIEKVREAWSLHLVRSLKREEVKAARVQGKRRSNFLEYDDLASAVSKPLAKVLARHFKIREVPVVDGCADSYGYFSGEKHIVEAEDAQSSIARVGEIIGCYADSASNDVLEFISGTLKSISRRSIRSLAESATSSELLAAREQWIKLGRLLARLFPELQEDFNGLTLLQWLSVAFAPYCLAPFLDAIRRGKKREITVTLERVSEFLDRFEFIGGYKSFLERINSDLDFALSLAALLRDLSILWGIMGFPFAFDVDFSGDAATDLSFFRFT
jgi:hypothetical protein